MLGSGVAAGAFGSLLGLGGGILIVPILTLGFGLPLREAVGVSLISVIVTSSAAAGVYLERHVANLRLGMTLELFTAIGALIGGSIAFLLDEQVLSLLFGALLLYVAFTMARSRAEVEPETLPTDEDDDHVVPPGDDLAPSHLDRLSGAGYRVRNLPLGIVGSTVAGVISALFGIGGGIVKVPVMHVAMGVPAPGGHRDEQHDDRDHRGGQRGHLPDPRRHRPVRRGPDGHRRLPRRDGRVAAGPPGPGPLPPAPVRGRPAVHGQPDAAARARSERHGPPDPGLHRRAPQRPPAHRVHLRLGRAAGDRGRADGRQRHLAAGRVADLRPGDPRRVAARPGARGVPVARPAGRHRRAHRPGHRGRGRVRRGRATG